MSAFRSGAVDPRRNEVVYKDLGLSFVAHPVTKNVSVLKNEDAVKRAIRNLILTNKGEKFFDELYGGNILGLLFENFTPVTEIDIEENIKNVIKTEEPRATVIDVEIIASPDTNNITINIIFRINDSPDLDSLTFTVERVR